MLRGFNALKGLIQKASVPKNKVPISKRSLTTVAPSETATADISRAIKPKKRRIGRWLFGGLILAGIGVYNSKGKTLMPIRKPLVSIVRFNRALWVGAAVSLDYKWSLRNLEEDTPEYEAKIKTVHLRTAQRLLNLCLTNAGLYIKGGQYIAANNHVVPPEYIETLKILQDQVPNRPFEDMERIFVEDLGHPLEYYFKEFDKKPIAAASLAQVHHAVLHDGREVAVKLQYPELQERFDGDMWTHDVMLKMIAKIFPDYDFSWTGDIFREILRKEMDFMHEAENSERAYKNITNKKDCYIPTVHWNITGPRVMTSEFIHGVKINDAKAMKKIGIEPRETMEKMINVLGEQIFVHGFLHADPHPGNLMVRKNPQTGRAQVVLLDHGLYNELSEDFRVRFCKMYKSLVLNKFDDFRKLCLEIGIEDWKLFGFIILMRPLDKDTRVGMKGKMTKEQIKELMKGFEKEREKFVNVMKAMPPEMLLLLRNNNLVRSINHELGAPVNRFTLFARQSVRGIQKNKSKAAFLSSWKDSLSFEGHLKAYEAGYWFAAKWLQFLIWLGFMPKEITMEGMSFA